MTEPDRMADVSLIDTKAGLRREAMARRDALPAELRQAAGETIASRASCNIGTLASPH